MAWILTKAVIAAAVVVIVSEIGVRWPRWGALVLSLPIVSILAFVMTYLQHGDLPGISRLARETVVLVLIGLPFFLPLGLAGRLGLGFWPAFGAGILLAGGCIGLWMALGPKV